jgi:hypothetical protein
MDHRISGRFAPNARPTIAANSFIDKANDVVNRLGVWSPSMGWELMSYSWLVDWAVNLGSSIENASAYSALSGRYKTDYAYLTTFVRMSKIHTSRSTTLITGSGTSRLRHNLIGGTQTQTVTITKDRRPVSPFGLGVNLQGLTTSQFATLVALGLARSK